MKFAFSTLGCPSWTWKEVLSAAHDLGYDGIEIRGLGKEIYAPRIMYFQPENLPETQKKLADLGLEITCFTTACNLYDKENQETVLRSAHEYVDVASRTGVEFIRLLGDEGAAPGENIDAGFVAENLKEIALYAKDKGVTALLETNGVFADTALCAKVLRQVDEASAGILWDVHHPHRYYQEKPEYSYENVKEYLRYIHMKDSCMEDGRLSYRMMGWGDVPNLEILSLLRKEEYHGYVSLEWVKRWNMDLLEPGMIFPQFINYVRDYMEK